MKESESTSQLELERILLDRLLAGDAPQLIALRAQLAQARVASREFTRFGFFVTFGFDRPVFAVVPNSFELMDVSFELVGAENAGGAVLFVRRGRLDMLEGVLFNDRWPANPRLRSVGYRTSSASGSAGAALSVDRDVQALDRIFSEEPRS